MFRSGTHVASSSGFTAINRSSSSQLDLSSQFSATSQTQQCNPTAHTTNKSSRHRNPAVALYLGLDASSKPDLAKYALNTGDHQSPPQATRKRRLARNSDRLLGQRTKANIGNSSNVDSFDARAMVKKPKQSTVYGLDEPGERPLPKPAATISVAGQETYHQAEVSAKVGMPNSTAQQHAPGSLAMICGHGGEDEDEDDFGQLCFEFEPTASTANEPSSRTQSSGCMQFANAQFDENEFDDDLVDDDLLDLDTSIMLVSSCPDIHLDSHVKTVSTQHTQGSSWFTDGIDILDQVADAVRPSSKKFISPVTFTTRLLAGTGDKAQKPFVRPPYPTATRDRSPIIGMSSNTLLRTCFRIGEAISQSCRAANTGTNILIELYARVLSSERDDLQQRFTFCDVFHARPPYIQATYTAAIWKSVRLFEYDSARLLQQGRMCRCIGSMKRSGREWNMTVLNIWEATWDDVEWVQGIVES